MFATHAFLALIPLTEAGDKAPITLAASALVECEAKVVRLASDDKGQRLLIADERGVVYAWDVGKKAFAWRNAASGLNDKSEAKSESDVPFVRALDIGEKFAFVGRGLPVPNSLEVATGKESGSYMMVVTDPGVRIIGVACDPRDRWSWVAFENGTLGRYVPNASATYSRRSIEGVKLRSLAFEPDKSSIAVGCADGTIRFANGSSASLDDKVLKGPEVPLTALHFANGGALILAGSDKGDVYVWNMGSGKIRSTVHVGDAPVSELLVHPKNKWFVTGDVAGAVKVWSLDKGELVATLTAEAASRVFDLAFVDGAKSLAGAVGGKHVVAWDVSKL